MEEFRSLPWEQWPLGDQEVFTETIDTTSAATMRQFIHKWSYWLAFISTVAPDRLKMAPEDRPTDDLVDRLITKLMITNSDLSIGVFLHHLYCVAVKITGPTAWEYLRLQRNFYRKKGVMAGTTRSDASICQIMRIGYEMMNEVDQVSFDRTSESEICMLALQYRDGLLLVFAASFLMRLRNIADRELPTQDIPVPGETWLFELSILQTKGARSALLQASDALSLRLSRYCDVYRPMIPGSAEHNGLWASRKRSAMSPLQIYKRVCRATGSRLSGHHVNLREMRRIGATAFAGAARENADLLRRLLTQGPARTAELHYNLGGSRAALALLQNSVQSFRTRVANRS